MKVFFALVAFGLLTSVLSGLYMAWRFSRKPLMFGTTLIGGCCGAVVALAGLTDADDAIHERRRAALSKCRRRDG